MLCSELRLGPRGADPERRGTRSPGRDDGDASPVSRATHDEDGRARTPNYPFPGRVKRRRTMSGPNGHGQTIVCLDGERSGYVDDARRILTPLFRLTRFHLRGAHHGTS